MNEKKAKRLRQLVKHLMNKGGVAESDWRVLHPQTQFVEDQLTRSVRVLNEETKKRESVVQSYAQVVATGTVRLDPRCGRAIYQQMKSRAQLNHRPA
jgi:hypothetical protein